MVHPCRIIGQLIGEGLQRILVPVPGQELVAVVTRKHEEHEADEEKRGQRASRRLPSILRLFIAGGVHWRMLNAHSAVMLVAGLAQAAKYT